MMADWLEEFQEYLVSQKGLSANTVRSYLKDVEHYGIVLLRNRNRPLHRSFGIILHIWRKREDRNPP